jgi:predicted nucleotidyltransferase
LLTPKQIKIFKIFLRKPFKEFTYSEIKEFSKEKSNSIIQNAISKFLKDNLVIKKQIGNMFLYKINFENSTVFSYFDILIKEEFPHILNKTIETIIKEIEISFISIVIFGSYATGEEKKSSDIDIAVFVSSKKDKKDCEIAFKSVELKIVHKVDFHVFTKNEMLEMLNDKFENLGKQIAKKHIAIHNPMVFYSILKEGINNGFKIVY